MKILLDYRPALRARTGVGEWVHQLARSLATLRQIGDPAALGVDLAVFCSSWRDRPDAGVTAELPGVRVIDRHIPVRPLTWCWNRTGWPPVESLARDRFDVVHSSTPLLIPARSGLRVSTICDLDFLDHPERAWGEMRRDFPSRIRQHAAAADLVVTISAWSRHRICEAARAAEIGSTGRPDGYILFVGTLEPRKNVGGLLEAYTRLRAVFPEAPRLVLAGGHTDASGPWIDRANEAPLRGHVDVLGYVPDADRVGLYRNAAMLVLPSFDEGFGLPVLEAMSLGVPVVASDRGALPEVVGTAGPVVDAEDPDALCQAMRSILTAPDRGTRLRDAGILQASRFDWLSSAKQLLLAYRGAMELRASAPRASRPGLQG
jgi:glycosyltransferase involved in cell wall biosynthesis